jgi:hypothetical protein
MLSGGLLINLLLIAIFILYEAEMQKHYQHQVPSCDTESSSSSSRKALIFRHGTEKAVKDNGNLASEIIDGNVHKKHIQFGDAKELCANIPNILSRKSLFDTDVYNQIEKGVFENDVLPDGFTRAELYDTYLHRQVQRGVVGNKTEGCCSIVKSNNFKGRHEKEKSTYIYYSASVNQGSHALKNSKERKLPVRLFRSSKIWYPRRKPVKYYYGGLHCVRSFKEREGHIVFKLKKIGN